MAAAIVAAAGVAAISAVAQYYQAEKARKASEAELAKIRAMWDSLVPPDYDASITDPPEYIKTLPAPPSFSLAKIPAPVFEMIGKYEPQIAPYIAEQAPQIVKQTAAGKEGKQAQIDALRRLKSVSSSKTDPALQGMLDESGRQSQIQAQSRQQSLMQDMQRRGLAGSGMALAAQLGAQEQAMGQSAEQGRAAAIEGYRQRLQALRDSASLGGDIQQSEFSQQGRNADIINSFNQRMSTAQQSYMQRQADIRNQAQMRNLDEQQRLSDLTKRTGYDSAMAERGRSDDLAQQNYGNKMGQVNYYNQINEARKKWGVAEQDRLNDIKTQRFNNEARIISGKTGTGYAASDLARQTAQDRNALYQGLGNAAGSGIQYYGNYQDRQEARDDRKRERDEDYDRYGKLNLYKNEG